MFICILLYMEIILNMVKLNTMLSEIHELVSRELKSSKDAEWSSTNDPYFVCNTSLTIIKDCWPHAYSKPFDWINKSRGVTRHSTWYFVTNRMLCFLFLDVEVLHR